MTIQFFEDIGYPEYAPRFRIEDVEYCPACGAVWKGTKKYGTRVIALEDPNIYDGTCYWICPDCNACWDAFTGEMTKEPDE